MRAGEGQDSPVARVESSGLSANGHDASAAEEWRGIHITRGMRLRIGELRLSLADDGSVDASSVEISVSIDLYVHWLEIAMGHLVRAEEAHIRLLEVWELNDDAQSGVWLEGEFAASMQCITASAVALDAFYALARHYVLVPKAEVEAWRRNRTARPRQMAEVLRRAFLIGPKSFKTVRQRLEEVSEWRDWSVHPRAGFEKPVRYDELHVGVEWRFVAFRFDNAKAILGFALSFVAQALSRPKPYPELVEHCNGVSPLVASLVGQWEDRYGLLYER